MKLIKTSILSSMSTLVKILTGILSLKIVALYTGPEGVAILGQFTLLVNVLSVIAGGGIGLGVIKYVAEFASDPQKLYQLLNTTAAYTFFFSIMTLIFGIVYSRSLSIWILGSPQYTSLIQWMSVTQVLIAANLLICSILNGMGKIYLLIINNIISSIVGVFLISIIAIYCEIETVLFALVLSQAISFLISLALVYRENWLSSLLSFKLNNGYLFKLTHYSMMSIVSTLTVPIAQILVRNDLSTLLGWDSVGYWQAVVRLSDAYLLFVTTALTAYYLPRLSELTDIQALKREIWQIYKIFMPIIAFSLILIFIFRNLIIFLLYSESFSAASDLFLYQLLGDFFRIAGWLFTYLLIAKSRTKAYITSEIILSVLFVTVSYFLVRGYGLIGVTYAFALTYFFYWLLMAGLTVVYFKREKMHAY